jgi:hypothetical protein
MIALIALAHDAPACREPCARPKVQERSSVSLLQPPKEAACRPGRCRA